MKCIAVFIFNKGNKIAYIYSKITAMITANELRVGNKVLGASRGGVETVTGSMIAQIEDRKVNVNPIPLTPEILEKAGFDVDVWSRLKIGEYETLSLGRCANETGLPYAAILKQKSGEGFSIKEAYHIMEKTLDFDDDDAFLLKKGDSYVGRSVMYVHQLQNLYYALTGSELQIIL